MSPKASIIIPVYNQPYLTNLCLEYLKRNSPSDIEIVVVDNASQIEIVQVLAKHQAPNFIVHHNENNLGFAIACNQGAKIATGEILVFLNNDTVPHPGWLDYLLQTFAKEQNLGIAGSKLLFPDNTVQHAGVAFYVSKLPYHLYQGLPGDMPCINYDRYFQAITGACMAIPKKLYSSLGGFDESYLNGLEDVDFCLRVGEAGKKIKYISKSCVTHFESQSIGRNDNMVQNRNHFLSKWSNKIVADDYHLHEQDQMVMSYSAENGRFSAIPKVNFNALTFQRNTEAKELLRNQNILGAQNIYSKIAESFPYCIEALDLAGKLAVQLGAPQINEKAQGRIAMIHTAGFNGWNF